MKVKKQRYKSSERKDQIKESILDIIYHDGLNKLSTRNLSKKVGVSEGALFRHYPNKKSMVIDIMNDVLEELIRPLEEISNSTIPAKERLEDFVCFTLDYLYEKKGITLLLFTEASFENDEGLKSYMYDIFHFQKEYFSKIVKDGMTTENWDNSISIDYLSSLYMGIPITLNIEMILKTSDFDYHIFCKQMKQLIFKILAK